MTERVTSPFTRRRVSVGDPIKADDINAVGDYLRTRLETSQLGSTAIVPTAIPLRYFEITALDNINRVIQGKGIGSTAPEFWTITLPPIFSELSRPFPTGTVTYSYSVSDINQRTASGPQGPDETQRINPPLLVGEVISTAFSNLTQGYVLNGDGRMWGTDPLP